MNNNYRSRTKRNNNKYKSTSSAGTGCLGVIILIFAVVACIFSNNNSSSRSSTYASSSYSSKNNNYSNNFYNKDIDNSRYDQYSRYYNNTITEDNEGDTSDGGKTKSTEDDDYVKNSDIDEEQTYVLNKHTKVFHRTWCRDVKKIKKKNYKKFVGTRDKAIKKGYRPCKHCDP